MHIAVLGAGAIGKGYAAYLSDRGHRVTLWSPSGRDMGRISAEGILTATGLCEGEFRIDATASPATALRDAEAAIIALPANGHAQVIDAITPHVREGQKVIVSAELSMSALVLAEAIAKRGLHVPVAAWATTVLAAKSTGSDSVEVSLLRKRLDIAAVPTSATPDMKEFCEALFGVAFEQKENLLATTLSNLNPPAHMAIALCNFTRMEKSEDWSSYGCITDGVGNLMEDLDRERLALASAFGLSVRSVFDHYVHSFGVERAPVGRMAQEVAQARPHVKGPKSLDTRFVTEDVPFGLYPLVVLGRLAGIDLPLHNSGVTLFSSLYRREFGTENSLLERLRLADETISSLLKRVR